MTVMSRAVVCEGCGQRLDVPDDHGRRKFRCPECGVYSELPADGNQSAAPASGAAGRAASAPSEAAEEVLLSVMAEPLPEAQADATPPPAAIPQPEEPPAEDESRETYDVAGRQRQCPGCNRPVAPDAVVCTACGLHLESGTRAVRTYQPRSWQWEAGLPLRRRRNLFLAAQVIFLGLGLIAAIHDDYLSAFLSSWLLFTLMLAFLLGTFDRIDLIRTKRGRAVLTRTWRIGFFARPTETIPLREYEGVTTGTARDVHILDWLIGFMLLPMGIVPGVLWWYYAIRSDSYFVALCKNHGYPELTLYRGWSAIRAKEIADTLHDMAGLPYQDG